MAIRSGEIIAGVILITAIAAIIIVFISLNQIASIKDSYQISDTQLKHNPDLSNPERLNVSKPSFSASGIRFDLNDNRSNTALWISVKIEDKDILSWISLSSVKSGAVFVPFRDCKYFDAGIDSLRSAATCKVTVGAKLANDKIVYTAYDSSISEFRTALLNSVK